MNSNGCDIETIDSKLRGEILNHYKTSYISGDRAGYIENNEPNFIIRSFCNDEHDSISNIENIPMCILGFQIIPAEYWDFYETKRDTRYRRKESPRTLEIAKNILYSFLLKHRFIKTPMYVNNKNKVKTSINNNSRSNSRVDNIPSVCLFLVFVLYPTIQKSLQEGDLWLDSMHQLKDSNKCPMCGSREGTKQCKYCELLFCEKCYWMHIQEYRTKGMNPIAYANFRKYWNKRKQQPSEEDSEGNGTKEISY